MNNNYIITEGGELRHWGIKGMRWGVRRYQNEDGTLTTSGKKRYRSDAVGEKSGNVTDKSGRDTRLKAAVGGGKVVLGTILATQALKRIDRGMKGAADFRPEVEIGTRVAIGLVGGAVGAASVAIIGSGVKNIRGDSTNRSTNK